jgi:predicted AlkP superfamily pyrophosphatase or phosphodiesterase
MHSSKNPIKPRVVLFLIDGMRPDAIQITDTPAMDSMIKEGTYSLRAETTFPSVTLPCHTSLIHSVVPERHGILTNTWVPQVRPVPGLFDVLHQAGKTAAFFYNWEQLRDLSSPGSLAASKMLRYSKDNHFQADWELTQAGLEWLTHNDFDFAFFYLGITDVAGHNYGWMTEPYLAAIGSADRCIAHVMETLTRETSYIVIADHGGHDRMHGTQLAEDMRIPVLAKGPGIEPGRELDDGTSILDIALSILQIFDLPAPGEWMGTPLF